MLAKTPIGTRFYRWVAAQPPEREYIFARRCKCACGMFMQEELGISRDDVWMSFQNYCREIGELTPDYYKGIDPMLVDIWKQFNNIARPTGNPNYGALRERIEQLMPECVA